MVIIGYNEQLISLYFTIFETNMTRNTNQYIETEQIRELHRPVFQVFNQFPVFI